MDLKRYQLYDVKGNQTIWSLVDTMPLTVLETYTNDQKAEAELELKRLNDQYDANLREFIRILREGEK